MKGLIVDTGVFYALLDSDDSYHKQAQAELNQVIRQNLKLYTSFPVLLESYSLILYRLGFIVAQDFLKYCDDCIEIINPVPEQYQKAQLKITQYPDQKITLVDAITAILSEEEQLLVWSYDFHFDIMQSTRWRS